MKKKTIAHVLVGALALGHVTCQAILTAPAGSSLFLVANPPFIAAHGDVSVISAHLLDATGSPVADGTVVQFFTTLGRIEEQGKTNDGVARVNLTSDSRSGPAEVTATSGDVLFTITVDIGAFRPTSVIPTADPPFIPSNSRTTHIFANVLDQFGNPVANVPVVFQVISPTTGTEFMESGGAPQHTDTNGRAEDILRTRRPFGTVGPPATVLVIVLGGPQGQVIANTVDVPIQ